MHVFCKAPFIMANTESHPPYGITLALQWTAPLHHYCQSETRQYVSLLCAPILFPSSWWTWQYLERAKTSVARGGWYGRALKCRPCHFIDFAFYDSDFPSSLSFVKWNIEEKKQHGSRVMAHSWNIHILKAELVNEWLLLMSYTLLNFVLLHSTSLMSYEMDVSK